MDFINKLIIANELEDVFNDTLNIINSNDILKIIRKSQTETILYSAECEIDLPQNPNYEQEISVTMNMTFEAAQKLLYKYQNERIAVLNFASATNPGGGVVNGARAQEESLCRVQHFIHV